MEKIATLKKDYTIYADEKLRGFFACAKQLKADCEKAAAKAKAEAAASEAQQKAAAAKAAAKRAKDLQRAAAKDSARAAEAAAAAAAAKAAAAEQRAAEQSASEAAAAAAKVVAECAADTKQAAAINGILRLMQQKQFCADDITKDFLLQYIPLRFNAAQQICTIKKIAAEEEEEARAKFADTPQLLEERNGILCICKPLAYFTANSFLSLFCSAAEQRKKQRKENASEADKQQRAVKAAEAEAKRIAAYKVKIAAYEAKIAAVEQKAQ